MSVGQGAERELPHVNVELEAATQRIQQLQNEIQDLQAENQRLMKLRRRQKGSWNSILYNLYLQPDDDVIPMAKEGWRDLQHDISVSKARKKPHTYGHSVEDTTNLRGEIKAMQEKQRSKIRFIDHSIVQMAGGEAHVHDFVNAWIKKSPLLKRKHPAINDRVPKSMILSSAKHALGFTTKRGQGDGQTEVDRRVVDAVYTVMTKCDIVLQEIEDAGISGYGFDSKQSLKKLVDGVPRLWSGRPTKDDQIFIDQLEKLLEENSDQCPCRTTLHMGQVKPVWELRQSIASILAARSGAIRGVSAVKLRQLMKRELPWFKKAKSKFFCCGHCDQRYHDAWLLNDSELPIYLIVNKMTPRRYNEESLLSRDIPTNTGAATLHVKQWLPDQVNFERMIRDAQADKLTEEDAQELRNAWNRLQNTQYHYIESVQVRDVKNKQEARARNEHASLEDHGFCVSVSDHITSVMMGMKKRMTMDESAAQALEPLMIFVQTIDHELHNNVHRTAFVVISMRSDKTGWGITEVEELIFSQPECEKIIQRCKHLQNWSDHGGSFPSEEVAGWVLGNLPARFKHLESVEFNSFAARHGKDRADSVGSMTVRWLREQQSTDEGLQARSIDDIRKHLQRRSDQNQLQNNTDLKIHFLVWDPDQAQPDNYHILNLGNTRKSYSKVFYRREDNKSVVIEKGLPSMSNYKDQATGDFIQVDITVVPRKVKASRGKKKRKRQPRNYSKKYLKEWAEFRKGKAMEELVLAEVQWQVNPQDTLYKHFFTTVHDNIADDSQNANHDISSSSNPPNVDNGRRRVEDVFAFRDNEL